MTSPTQQTALPLRAAPPRPTLGLRRKPILLVTAALSVVVGVSVLYSLRPREVVVRKAIESKRPALIGDTLRFLPDDYGELDARTKKLPSPLPNRSEVNKPIEQANERVRARQRLADAAHASEVTFQGAAVLSRPGPQTSEPSAPVSSVPAGSSNNRDEDNRQDDKLAFLKTTKGEPPYLISPLVAPLSAYQLNAGTIISGVLLTGINSDLPGQILGQVAQNVFDSVRGRYLLVPQGARLLGEYDSRISYGQERVLIVWTRIIFPNGKSISLEGMPGMDLSGYAGMHEKVNNHYLKILSGVVFGSVLGASAQMAQGPSRTVDPSFGQLALQGAAQNTNEAGQQITRKNLNIQPTIEISPGQRFNVFVTKDVILEPYNQ